MKLLYDTNILSDHFNRLNIAEKLSDSMGERIEIDPAQMECLKATKRMSVYKLFLQTKTNQYPIILKTYNPENPKNKIEIHMYERTYHILKEFLPRIYHIEKSNGETWIFMEFVHQLRGQILFTPKHFDYVIPTVAKLHAHTFEENFHKHQDIWKSWLPIYESSYMRKNRAKYIEKTIDFLDAGAKDELLMRIIKPYHKSLITLLHKGPDFFPELFENGSSITHGDLHMQNICSNNVRLDAPWYIQFIDWESAKYAPVWFDMVVLVEILLGFRTDWQSNAEEIRTHCVNMYTKEMEKYGIQFKMPPMHLYKMAYLQRTLEKGLHMQLRRAFDNRGGELLPYHLGKIASWGSEFGLLE